MASAAQVRQPVRQKTASTATYGDALALFRGYFVDFAVTKLVDAIDR